ncbi:MAG: peptide chain release factor N(5)-glutamine methyltransferase [Alcanivoracaceae bacterium]|nr:peptide chain release factor N(5)-glutamine methyltransferase [Alcanivoracaceae bacterium]
MTTIAALLKDARGRLADSDTAALDAELLLCHVLGKPRSHLFTWPEQEVGELVEAQFHHLLTRRASGEPVAYLLGRREFFGHEFLVSPDTLIPRPDTELLVDVVLEKLPAEQPLRIADLGTGSGAIAISLGLARPAWQLLAVDYIVAVLDLVERNVRRLHAGNIRPLQSSWYSRLDGVFDAIVSNPPYIRADDVHLQRGDVRFEPRSALVSGDDGLDDIRLIIQGAPARLRAGGLLALEHGYHQGAAVRELLQGAGFQSVETRRDYGDNERVTFGFHGASDAQ